MGRDGLSVVEKTTRILEAFLQSGTGSLSFSEICASGGLSPATTHRVLNDMARCGLLSQHAQRDEYRLGPMLRSVGVLAAAGSSARTIAEPYAEELRDRCAETVIVAELHGSMVVPVVRADGLHELRMNQELGRRYPAYAGATGKVLLAHLDPDHRDALLAAAPLDALTPRTPTDRESLRRELDEIRAIGVAASRGERVPDAVAMSAPLFEAPGTAVAALTISGVVSRSDEASLVSGSQLVKEFAERISAELGHRPEAGSTAAERLCDPATKEHATLLAMCHRAWAGAGGDRPEAAPVRAGAHAAD